MVNLKGEIVGINVAIFSTSGGYQGVGFAIPINNAKRIINKLIEGKKILYGWLGVTVQDLTDDLAKYFGLPDKRGVLVAKVLENSPAQKAGIKERDVVKEFDNKPVNNVKELLNAVAKTDIGRKIKMTVTRDKKELVLQVEIGQRPENVDEEGISEEVSGSAWRGLEVADLGSQEARGFKAQEKEGVVIVNIEADSPADDSGLMPGEVIIEINKQAVKNISDYEKITKDLKADALIRTSRGYFLVKGEEKQ